MLYVTHRFFETQQYTKNNKNLNLFKVAMVTKEIVSNCTNGSPKNQLSFSYKLQSHTEIGLKFVEIFIFPSLGLKLGKWKCESRQKASRGWR